MAIEDQEIVQDFLLESNENLSRVEQEILALEQRPDDPQILGSIFRSFHTVKGTCGFLGFGKLESITHHAENLLAALRDGKKKFNPGLASLILETLDIVMQELSSIGATGAESDAERSALMLKLQAALSGETPAAAPAAPVATAPKQEEHNDEAASAGAALSDPTIRIDIRLIDRLINLVGELVLVRNQMLQSSSGDGGQDKTTAHRLNQITTELQESVMRSRMQPIGTIWNKIPRLVRDTAKLLNKDIRLVTDGANTEMDRTILEAVKDPLTHILRNSCDHGLETPDIRIASGKPSQGTVILKAYHEGGQVVVEIQDDGRGIDPEKLRSKAVEKGIITAAAAAAMSDREAIHLIFHAGFSTAEKVTNISGRGVGMDVVRKNIQSIGGVVDVESHVGTGTKVKIRIPLTLAIIPGLVVGCGQQTFVIPQVNLIELIRLQGEKLSQLDSRHEGRVLRWRDQLIPVLHLGETLGMETSGAGDVLNLAILEAEGAAFGLILDRIRATREIVVKPLGKQLKSMRWYAGATILGDGSVALILDVAGLARLENLKGRAHEAANEAAAESVGTLQQFLVVKTGSYQRVAVALGQVDRLEKIESSRIERLADSWAVQYRGTLLRLVSLSRVLGAGGDECMEQPQLPVIVIRNGDRVIGLVVDRILDVQEGELHAATPTSAPGLLATFVLHGRATELLDIPTVLAAADPVWTSNERFRKPSGLPVLVGVESRYDGAALMQGLELGGFPVDICEVAGDLERRFSEKRYRAVVLAAKLGALAEPLRRQAASASVPVFAAEGACCEGGWLAGEFRMDDTEGLRRLIGALANQEARCNT